MKFISLFSGIGGFDLGLEQAGHECVAQVEWDKNAAGVLKRRWPDVPLFCDVTKVTAEDLPEAELICFGFPCQDLSVAGKREGLQGKRSGLFYESTRLVRELLAKGSGLRFALAENVAGLLSADDGVALAKCIRELLDCGASEVGYRILDSQYFGVAQRRRRVFIVSDFGGQSCDEILAVTESLPRHPPPRRKTGQGSPSHARASAQASSWTSGSFGGYEEGVGTVRAAGGDLGGGSETLVGDVNLPESDVVGTLSDGAHMGGGLNGQDVYTGRILAQAQGADVYPQGQQALAIATKQQAMTVDEVANTLAENDYKEPVAHEDSPTAFHATQDPISGDKSPAIGANAQIGVLPRNMIVRRLTCIECERLQGFPDHWTEEREELELIDNQWHATPITHPQADGPRYKQLGNAVTVNVAKWLGLRLMKTHR